MSELSYRIFSGITLMITAVSVCCSSYIIRSWIKLKKRKVNDILSDYVAYMSIFDLLFMLFRGLYVTNPTFKWIFISEMPIIICKIMGACINSSAICMTTWNFTIAAFILLPIIRGKPMHKITKQKCNHFIFVSFTTFIVVLIPIINDGYGFTDNAASHYGLSKYECWIKEKADFISVYGPITLYVVFSILLLIYCICFKFKYHSSLNQLKSQLIWYTAVFVCVWGPSIINRYYNVFTNSSSYILTYIAMLSVHSVGFGNAAVWYHYMIPSNDENDDTGSNTTNILIENNTQLIVNEK
eukprot:541351_1